MCNFCVKQPKPVKEDTFFDLLMAAILEGVTRENKKEQKKVEKKSFYNGVDASFLINVDTYYAKRYLLPRIVSLAKKSNLTVADFRNVRIGDTITVGSSEKFDLDWLPTSSDEEGRPREIGSRTAATAVKNGENFPIHNLSEKYKEISEGIELLGQAYTLMLEIDTLEYLTGARPLKPTYATLMAERIGRVSKTEKKVKEFEREVRVTPNRSKGCVTIDTDDGGHAMITEQFIKVGYNYIPVGRNNTIDLYV